jgi:hypothetical protein
LFGSEGTALSAGVNRIGAQEPRACGVGKNFDVLNLFAGVAANAVERVEPGPTQEEWEIDYQGYLVKKNPPSGHRDSL